MGNNLNDIVEAIEALPKDAYLQAGTDLTLRCGNNLKALAAELKELREFVGAMNNIGIEEWYGRWQKDGTFAFFDHNHHLIASGTDPFDAWRKMNAGEGENSTLHNR